MLLESDHDKVINSVLHPLVNQGEHPCEFVRGNSQIRLM
jgi:hypothetical protein